MKEAVMTIIGFVGLGAMGGRVVKRLLDAGYPVVGYNRTKPKVQWLLDAGMQWGETPRKVAEAADVVFSMVTNTAVMQDVVAGQDGILAGLAPGKVYIDMSTISPDVSREVASKVAAMGAQMLDAPVSGSVVTLEEGNLSIMVGGDQVTFEKVKSILQHIGAKVNYVGANGQALLMKIAINLNLAIQFLGFCEGLLLAEKGGIPRETAIETMLNSVIISPSLKYRVPLILSMPKDAWFNVNMMQKDMLLALELGRNLNVPLPVTATSNELLTSARALGLDNKDFAIVYEVLAQMAGLHP
jgi:3-hydroxyisobutyrate dehydrogenase-like beta-hydroxyacid dehydrogenase